MCEQLLGYELLIRVSTDKIDEQIGQVSWIFHEIQRRKSSECSLRNFSTRVIFHFEKRQLFEKRETATPILAILATMAAAQWQPIRHTFFDNFILPIEFI